MRAVSLFSGAGGMDLGLHNAGITTVAMCEIDKHARATLARNLPGAPIFEDVTTLTGEELVARCGPIDMVHGGFPCQDLSVAGKRVGLGGERSGLFWHALRIAHEVGAEWVLLENVPGLLTSNDGKDWVAVLDALQDAGYMVDPEIYDARLFGVAQRRRRVFITCRLASKTVNGSTPRSLLTMGQVLVECWLASLACLRGTSLSVPPPWDSPLACVSGLRKRMRLFDLGTPEEPNFERWLSFLAAGQAKSALDGASFPAASGGDKHAGTSPTRKGEPLSLTPTTEPGISESASWPTEQRWSEFLAALSLMVKSCTTSTATSQTTEQTICTSSRVLPIISEAIAALTVLSPDCWQPASSASTAIRVCTNYAIQASGELTSYLDWVHDVDHIVAAAERASVSLGDSRAELRRAIQVLLEPESSPRGPRPSATPGQVVAALTGTGVGTCDPDDNQAQAGHLVPFVKVVRSGARDNAMDNGGETRATVLVPTSFGWQNAPAQGDDVVTDGVASLRTNGPPAVLHDLAVRRLMPVECERLMGWPDNWTIGADSHRYRQCGNGVVAPVAEWIGRRLMGAAA